jgi:hypothetical protein
MTADGPGMHRKALFAASVVADAPDAQRPPFASVRCVMARYVIKPLEWLRAVPFKPRGESHYTFNH